MVKLFRKFLLDLDMSLHFLKIYNCRISANARMVGSLIITLVVFIVSTALVKIDTDTCKYIDIISILICDCTLDLSVFVGQQGFFAVTMVSVIVMNCKCCCSAFDFIL